MMLQWNLGTLDLNENNSDRFIGCFWADNLVKLNDNKSLDLNVMADCWIRIWEILCNKSLGTNNLKASLKFREVLCSWNLGEKTFFVN